MKPYKRLGWIIGGAGIVITAVIGADVFSAPTREGIFFDEVLRANRASCVPNGVSSQSLIKYYQKIAAAKTELEPFPTKRLRASSNFLDAEPPLWDNLGDVSFSVTTDNAKAQRYFDQGFKLAYAFNHAEARRAFRMAQKLDPKCAMCFWGEALVLGPNINAPMEQDALPPALTALRQAEAKAFRATAKEQALIAALARRYSNEPTMERATLDAAYAEAMGDVARRFPDDEQITVLYVESLMDMQPWDYWVAGGTQPKGRTGEILDLLEELLAKNPDHPGAIHYYIHMVEASTQPDRAEPYARRLANAMPGAGHLVHMPFHVLYRIGKYKDALAANKAAVVADETYISQVSPEGIYPQAYYPHNVHSLMVSAQMAGAASSAIEAAEKLSVIVSDEAIRNIPWVQPIKVAPYFTHAQFSSPSTILALSDPGDSLPYVKAMWHYARGTAYAAKGAADAASTEAESIAKLLQNTDFSELISGGVPAPDLLELARHVVLGRIAQAVGDLAAARFEFQAAVAIEDELAYMEPPFWYYPVRQSLGAVLLQMGAPREAEAIFLQSLLRVPNNGWALYGLAQSYEQLGDKRAATKARQRFEQAWAGGHHNLELARL